MYPLNVNVGTSVITAAVLLYIRSGVLCEPLCLTGDFDTQLRHILDKQMLSPQEQANIISRVLEDVRRTLNKRWQGYEMSLFGSLATGLATIQSDMDFYVQIPNYNSSASLYVLKETKNLFTAQPALFTRVEYRRFFDYAALYVRHIPTQRKVDLVFSFGEMGVAHSNLLRYYFNLDKRFLLLAGFLKYWVEIQRRNGQPAPKDYVLYMLIIFYLQQKNMAPSGYMLHKDSRSHIVDNWDVGFNELPYSSENSENVYQLLGGFFKYYSEFNFDEFIISTFSGRLIRKSDFMDIENFPEEYSLYKNNVKRNMQLLLRKYLNTSTIYIQDLFVHDEPLLKVSPEFTTEFISSIKSVATKFEELPRDSFLRAMLITNQHNETVFSHKNATADGINEQDCIEVRDPLNLR